MSWNMEVKIVRNNRQITKWNCIRYKKKWNRRRVFKQFRLFFWIWQKNKIQSEANLIIISVLDRKEFSLNGKIISFQNLSKFIKSEKNIAEQEDDGYSYIFPEYNLLLYVDYIAQSFMQILIYDDSLKDLYERQINV